MKCKLLRRGLFAMESGLSKRHVCQEPAPSSRTWFCRAALERGIPPRTRTILSKILSGMGEGWRSQCLKRRETGRRANVHFGGAKATSRSTNTNTVVVPSRHLGSPTMSNATTLTGTCQMPARPALLTARVINRVIVYLESRFRRIGMPKGDNTSV